jgi:hypothetical protein
MAISAAGGASEKEGAQKSTFVLIEILAHIF